MSPVALLVNSENIVPQWDHVDIDLMSCRCLATLLCLLLAMLHSGVSSAQQVLPLGQATGRSEGLELLVPAELPPVKFGSPVYVPLAVRNATNNAVQAPSFRYHNPDFVYVVRSGNAQAECRDYGQGFGRGDAHLLPAQSIETTVLLINIWAPVVAIEFLRTGEAQIEMTAYLSGHPDQPRLEAQNATTKLWL